MRVFKIGRKWYIDYSFRGKRIREAAAPSRKEAEAMLAARMKDIREKKFNLDTRKEKEVLFDDLCREFLAYSKTNKRSYERDVASVKMLKQTFGSRYLRQITPKMVEDYKAQRKVAFSKKRKRMLSPATANRELTCLKTMLNKAVEWEMVEANPAAKVKLLREPKGRLRYLTEVEANMLVECYGDHLKPIVVTALNTGMRLGEILKLKWEEVEFENQIIYVTNTKNGEQRQIPMNKTLTETLQGIKLEKPSPWVFCNPRTHNPYRSVRFCFDKAKREAGIEGFDFHDLRHTFASRLVMRGVDLVTVKELLGHKQVEMTLRYAHLSPKHKRFAVEVVEEDFEKVDQNLTKAEGGGFVSR